jgi:hypothetical protein
MAFISGVPAGGGCAAAQGELWLSVKATPKVAAPAKTDTALITLYLSVITQGSLSVAI